MNIFRKFKKSTDEISSEELKNFIENAINEGKVSYTVVSLNSVRHLENKVMNAEETNAGNNDNLEKCEVIID